MGCGASASPKQNDGEGCNKKNEAVPKEASPEMSSQRTAGHEGPLLDKVILRLDRAVVPSRDIGSQSDPVVTVELVDTEPFPSTFFGCARREDGSDLTSLTKHTFSEKENNNVPLWLEECFLVSYRSDPTTAPKGKVKVTAVDKDVVGQNDPLLTDGIIDIWSMATAVGAADKNATTKQSEPTGLTTHKTVKKRKGWHTVVLPCNCDGADPNKHFIQFSFQVQRAEDRIVSKEDVSAYPLQEQVIELKQGNLAGGGRAVVRYLTKPGNHKAFFWLPGLNASFHHYHCLPMLLDTGFDFYTLDCRRMGQSKRFGATLDPSFDALDAHTTADFEEYSEEIDAMVAMTLDSECDGPSSYEDRVLYGNSTGALTCVTYLRHGKHADMIDGLALNGPFFDWHLAPYAELLMSSSVLTSIYARLAVDSTGRYVEKGNGVSAYTLKTWSQYYFDIGEQNGFTTRSVAQLNTTTEWAKAVTAAQKALKENGPESPFQIPIFVISSASDEWVSSEEVLQTSDFLGPMRTEIQVFNAEHDVFLSTTKAKVDECLGYLASWLKQYFG